MINNFRKNIKYLLIILVVGILAWYQTLDFWFFRAFEATWLSGVAPYNIVNLIKGHAFLYFLDWKLFGWNPLGWYTTSLVLHLFASILLFWFVLILSKNRVFSFLAALFFVASTSYNDVLTWGSFNSYYPLLLIWMISSAVSFIKYKETEKLYFLLLSVTFAVLGFFTRETGILIVPLLAILDIVFSKNLMARKTIAGVFKRQVPLYIALVAFFVIRSFYGGVIGDTVDSNVKLQMKFVQDGLYFEYAKTAFLTFGKLIPPQVIPYPILNFSREYLSRFFPLEFLNNYYFSILGWVIFGALLGVFLKIKKSKEYGKIFLFFLIWLGIFSLFVSLVIPNTPEVLSRVYEYNTMRYRYFAFMGTSILLASILLYLFASRTKLLISIVSLVVLVNLFFIWRIEQKIYTTTHKPAREFYTKFNSFFPKLPKEAVFYIYPHASGLSDYLLEWYLTNDQLYPNLTGQPFRVESQIIAVLTKIQKGEINPSNVFFLDYNPQQGLLNKTEDVIKLSRNQKVYSPKLNTRFEGPFVEFPYGVEVNLALRIRDSFKGSQPDSARFRALVDYAVERNKYLNSASLKTAYTMSQRAGEPFFHVLPINLIDGNIGARSTWIADTFTPWVEVDLKEEKEVAAVSWGSKEVTTRAPATYSILAARDDQKFETVKEIKNFVGTKNIDIFDKPVIARFIRIEIKTTAGGDFVLLDEFEVISSNGSNVLSYYKDRDKLFEDIISIFKFVENKEDLIYFKEKGLNMHWGKISWETNMTPPIPNNQFFYFLYRINTDNQRVSFELPELEIYAGVGQFLKKNITSISIDFGQTPFIIDINSLKLVPRIDLTK